MPSTSRGSRRDFAALEARRYEAARLFARGESQAAVARALGATRAAAHRWFHAWQDQGRTALKAAGRAGRKPRLEASRSEEHTSELQSHSDLVCRLLLEKKKNSRNYQDAIRATER